jgi:hypothetical protein
MEFPRERVTPASRFARPAQDPPGWPEWQRRLVRLLAGHMPFGFASPNRQYDYISLLRRLRPGFGGRWSGEN